MTLAWLREHLGPSSEPAPAVDWAQIRAQSGIDFPPDYRALAESYPAMGIDEFLIVWHPAGPPQFNPLGPRGPVDLWTEWPPPEEITEYDPATGETRELPPEQHAQDRLIPWGQNDTRDNILLWLPDGEPDQWTVVVAELFSQWRYRGPCTDFLADVLSGRVICPYFPEDWPDPDAPHEIVPFH